jgi:hypothetical protein|nr:MAG TPA: hypothetical protein [Caudoviricetes sp.]
MQITVEFISMGELAILSMEIPRDILLSTDDITPYVEDYFGVPVDHLVSWSA